MSGLNRHIQIKEQRLEQASSSCNFKMCDELASEISELKSQCRLLNAELEQKAKKAAQYRNRKSNATQDDKSDDEDESGDPNLSLGLGLCMNLFTLTKNNVEISLH